MAITKRKTIESGSIDAMTQLKNWKLHSDEIVQ